MEIKIRTFKIITLIAFVLLTTGIISYTYYDKKRAELEYKKDIDDAINREYQDLLYQYNEFVETITDSYYSNDFRKEYVRKLNHLLEIPHRYSLDNPDILYIFEDKQKNNSEEDKRILKLIARRNVYNKIMSVDNE